MAFVVASRELLWKLRPLVYYHYMLLRLANDADERKWESRRLKEEDQQENGK